MMHRITLYSLLSTLYFILISCSQSTPNQHIILATTTSVHDSGLLDILIPVFEKESNFHIKPIAVGSGEAMAMGRRGDADVLVVHSPKDEEAFMNDGFGKSRRLIMTNTYVIVGPPEDPAKCLGAKSATEALAKISDTKSVFVSRADKSGTHKKEMSLWAKASITPTDTSYIQAQSGMCAVLQIADEKKGYTLTDRGTYLAFKSKIALKIMVEGDKDLINYYSVIVPNPDKFPKMNLKGAQAWADFLLAPATQKLIGEFGKDKFGEPLFYPAVNRDS